MMDLEMKILYMYPGAYQNIEDLEEKLSYAEMSDLFETAMKIKFDEHRFAAALQGAELDNPYEEDELSLEDIRARAQAKASGMTEDEFEFAGLFNIEVEDD